jgi:hypothetical protein
MDIEPTSSWSVSGPCNVRKVTRDTAFKRQEPGTRADDRLQRRQGMTEYTNREMRRHPEKFEEPEAVENAADEDLSRSRNVQESIVRDGPQDQLSVRAKNSGHGKKTADKWNQ